MALASLYADIGNRNFLEASDLVMHKGEQGIDQDGDSSTRREGSIKQRLLPPPVGSTTTDPS